MSTRDATWCRRGNHVPHRRPVTVVDGDTALARADYLHYEAQRAEVSMLVPTPPLFGRRSKLDGEVLRRCSRFNGAATIRDAI